MYDPIKEDLDYVQEATKPERRVLLILVLIIVGLIVWQLLKSN